MKLGPSRLIICYYLQCILYEPNRAPNSLTAVFQSTLPTFVLPQQHNRAKICIASTFKYFLNIFS